MCELQKYRPERLIVSRMIIDGLWDCVTKQLKHSYPNTDEPYKQRQSNHIKSFESHWDAFA